MFRLIRNIIVFPVAFVYVMLYLMVCFIRLFLAGNQTEYILQILFVKVQNRLDKLVYRAMFFTPIIYAIILIKIVLALHLHYR